MSSPYIFGALDLEVWSKMWESFIFYLRLKGLVFSNIIIQSYKIRHKQFTLNSNFRKQEGHDGPESLTWLKLRPLSSTQGFTRIGPVTYFFDPRWPIYDPKSLD